MKKLLIFLLLTFTVFGQYTTPGTGVEWTLDDLVTNSGGVVTTSTDGYDVNEEVLISQSDKVTIAAGTTVYFTNSNAGFEVEGTFSAVGTADNMVTFTAYSPANVGDWAGIYFKEESDAANCKLAYTKVEYADYGFRALSTSPTLENSHILNCNYGVRLSSSDAMIMNNTIEYCYGYGIAMTLGSNPTIDNNVIRYNNVEQSSFKNQIAVGIQGDSSPIITNNKIYGGGAMAGGISIWVYGATLFSNAEIVNNEIYDNAFGITLYSSSNGVVNVKVVGNYIHNNDKNPDPMAAGSGINLYGSSFNTPLIAWNTITENVWGITVMSGATTVSPGPLPKLGNVNDADTSNSGNNRIFNNGYDGDVYDLYNNTSEAFLAQNNDWGTNDLAEVEDHIYHSVDNSAYGEVTFSPLKNTSVPVELTGFSAVQVNGAVKLDWTTATELNNKEFQVYRNQELIATVDGQGTKAEATSYSFTDKYAVTGVNTYKLFQIDYDGTTTLVASVEVELDAPVEFALGQNYPNPFNPSTTISFTLPEQSEVKLVVYNMIGELVTEITSGSFDAGFHQVNFDASQLSSGAYIYQLSAGNFVQTRKMMLMK